MQYYNIRLILHLWFQIVNLLKCFCGANVGCQMQYIFKFRDLSFKKDYQ
jgi:hypothetical protein